MSIRIYVGNLPYTFREEDIAQLVAVANDAIAREIDRRFGK